MTKVYCPRCRNNLVSCPRTAHTDTDLVRYVCGECGLHSAWDFDAPVPLLISPRNGYAIIANRATPQGRSLWDAVRAAARTVREWPLWKRGRR